MSLINQSIKSNITTYIVCDSLIATIICLHDMLRGTTWVVVYVMVYAVCYGL